MSKHTDLIDAVNDAVTEAEHDRAEAKLSGWREGVEDSGARWSYVEADEHTMDRFGEERPMCCGVLLDWQPKKEGGAS